MWERDKHKHPICAELLTPELADELLTELAEQDANIKFWLNRELTALENYRDGGSLVAMMDMALEKRYPDRFQAINDEYQPRLDAMDVQIAALE